MRPIAVSVRCAFFTFGRRKAGTPFDTASTPVSAEQPLENARRMSRMMPACVMSSALTAKPALEAMGVSPTAQRARPTTIISAIEPMKM